VFFYWKYYNHVTFFQTLKKVYPTSILSRGARLQDGLGLDQAMWR